MTQQPMTRQRMTWQRMTWLRQITYCVLFAASAMLSGCAPALDFYAEHYFFDRSATRPATFNVVTKTGVGFTTSDGIRLVANIYLPAGLEHAPTILVRIPLTKNFTNELRVQTIARHWARRGYAVVIQGTRGRYLSGGEFYPLVNERQDGIETLKWLASQPWYDGRLAMWGGSAFGYTQWAVSDQRDPGPSAFSIQIASSNFRQMFCPGNAFSLESALYWTIRSRGEEDREVDLRDLVRGVSRLPISEADDVAIGDTDFYNDWVMNCENNKYWSAIDGRNRASQIVAPALLIGGWFDPFLPSQLEDFVTISGTASEKVATQSRLIIGPWGHAQSVKLPRADVEIPYRADSVTLSTPFFDQQLAISLAASLAGSAAVSEKAVPQPRVRIFVLGANRWRDENEWPLARTKYTPYYLSSAGNAPTLYGDGSLGPDSIASPVAYDSYTYDPANPVPTAGGALLSERAGVLPQNDIEARRDVLVYSTSALSQPLEVTGPVKAVLFVSTDAPSTDFTAKLVDVYPDGVAYNITDGISRVVFAEGTQTPKRIELDLGATSYLFAQGHKIRLEISSSNFPRYDRNPNTGEFIPTAVKVQPARQRVYHTEAFPSQLVLPIIPTRGHLR